MLFQELQELSRKLVVSLTPSFEHHNRLDDLPFLRIGNTHNTNLGNLRMLGDGIFNLRWSDAVPGAFDHVIFTGDKKDVAIFAHRNGIAHLIPTVDHPFLLRFQKPFVAYIRLPIESSRRSLQDHTACFIGFAFFPHRTDHLHLNARQCFTDGVGDRLGVHRIRGYQMQHFRPTQTFPYRLAGKCLPALQGFSTERIPTRSIKTDRTTVILLEFREFRQSPVGGRQAGEHRDLVFLDQFHHFRRPELGQQRYRSTSLERKQRESAEAGREGNRRRSSKSVAGDHFVDVLIDQFGFDDDWPHEMHTTFRHSRGTGSVEHDSDIVCLEHGGV